MSEPEAIKTSKAALRALEEFPTPAFSDWNKATEKELGQHVQELRLYVGQLLLSLKEMREVLNLFTGHELRELETRIDIVAQWQMAHDLQKEEE